MEELVMIEELLSYYKGKKVFVTGHTGFKGSWLLAFLSLSGARVKGYALAPEYEHGLFNLMAPLQSVESIISDILDKERLAKELDLFQPDFIFHLAAQPLVRRSYEMPAATFATNVTGTANLLEAVTRLPNKVTTVVITTDKVYENQEKDVLYNENDTLGGYDPYSASKACTELVVSSFRNSFFHPARIDQHQKAITTARAGNVIGGGDWNKDRIMPDIIRALQKNETINVRNPRAVRPWQHVIEPVWGYLRLGGLLDREPVSYSKPYNFGPSPGDHLTVQQLVEIAITSWGTGSWKDIADAYQPHEAGLLKLDIRRAEKELQWKPRLTGTEAVAWTTEWYKQPLDKQAAYAIEQIKAYANR